MIIMDPLGLESDRERRGSIEFLRFHVYNSVHPITYYLQGWTQSGIWTIKENAY